MDRKALLQAALESLHKEFLPKLSAEVEAALLEKAADPSEVLLHLAKESRDLFDLIASWTNQDSADRQPIEEAPGEIPAYEATIDDAVTPDGELSDEEAMAMLGESASLLEVASQEETAAAEGSTADGEMSDEEARALLAAMDSPTEPSKNENTDGEMSDEDARALLAAMDSPAEPQSAAPVESAAADVDDDAMRMLASLGGLDDAQEKVPVAPAPQHKSAGTPAVSASREVVGEIEEYEANDFASDPDMMKDFVNNTGDLMQTLDDSIIRLEQNPSDKETIEEIFRAAHTFKGAAGMFGFKAIERVMHRTENLFDLIRKGKITATPELVDLILQSVDILKKLVEAAIAHKPSGIKTGPIVTLLDEAATGKISSAVRAATPAQAPQGGGGGDDHEVAKKTEQSSTIRVDLDRLDALVNLVGELVIDRTRFSSIEEQLRLIRPQPKIVNTFTENVQIFGRHMNEIQDMIMKIRMVPIGNAFNKFTRVVRDIARQVGKQIDLIIEGEDTELDKTIVEQIGDPLIHLVRNACDHGIETPADRQAAGKSPAGQVNLSARQEGNHIIIEIQDDGKGMDASRIRQKAIEKGLITADAQLSQRDILNLIFEPGFSTAEKVTNLSGRGVGMDVVRKQIAKLKGIIDLSSELGKGSTITIQLPLTLAIVQSLIVGTEEDYYAIPLSAVVESIRIKPTDIQKLGDSDIITLREQVLPLIYLNQVLSLDDKSDRLWYANTENDTITEQLREQRKAKAKERIYVVVVGTADRRFGIVVDRLLNQQEMVIKSMGPLLQTTPCIAGGAVLGNGDVLLVLDIPQIEEVFRQKSRDSTKQAA